MTERFVAVEYDEVYYLTDTKDLKTFDDFKKEYLEVWGADSELTEDEINTDVMEEYYEYIYEHCMTCEENITLLNNYEKEVKELKQFKTTLKDNLNDRMNVLRRNIESAKLSDDPLKRKESLERLDELEDLYMDLFV